MKFMPPPVLGGICNIRTYGDVLKVTVGRAWPPWDNRGLNCHCSLNREFAPTLAIFLDNFASPEPILIPVFVTHISLFHSAPLVPEL